MTAVLIILPGAVVVDVVDHIVRAGAFERSVSGAASLRALASIEVTRIATAIG